MSIIIRLVHYPNHTFLQKYNYMKVSFISLRSWPYGAGEITFSKSLSSFSSRLSRSLVGSTAKTLFRVRLQ